LILVFSFRIQHLQTLIHSINSLNKRVGIFASWFSGLLVILVIYDVLMRYLFKLSSPWIMELEWHLFSILFLLGSAYTFQVDRHVRVDLFYSGMSKKDKARTDLLGSLLFLLPWSIFIMRYSFDYAMSSYQMGEGSPDPGGLPYRYIIKFCIVIGFFLLSLQAVANVLSAIQVLYSSPQNEESWEQ
jgi:TRAP-type mannitol/chloroaromatic compound transport system permease small subunit